MAVLVDRDPVVGHGQVLGGEPPVDRVLGHVVQAPPGGDPGELGLLALHGPGVGLADHLDVAERPVPAIAGQVEVVDAERLLEDGRRSSPCPGRPPPCSCGTCSCGPPGPSRWPSRWGGGRWPTAAGSWRCWTPRRRRPRCRPSRPRAAVPLDHHAGHACARSRSVSSFTTSALTSSVTFGRSSRGRTPMTSASALAWTRHG